MKKYIGVKVVLAKPMTRRAYNDYRGWDSPADENGDEMGYLVEYQNGSEGNHPDHEGYISWCPAKQFEEANQPINGMTFGHAIEAARKGMKIARTGWRMGMFVVMQPELKLPPFNTQGTNRKVNDRTAKFIGKDTPLNCVPYFAMYAADGGWVPGWLASQTDMLADDWMIVE